MKIVIETIPHANHRYETVGDWFTDPDGVQHILVSDMRDERYALLVAVHEIVEWALCKQRRISEETVTQFDLHCPDDEPGENPNAPYHREHMFAERIERQIAEELDVDWQIYDQTIRNL